MENIKFVDSSLNHEQETFRRIMLLHPCDTCTRVSAYSPSHRYHCYEYCPAFKSWACTSWYWISRRIKKSADFNKNYRDSVKAKQLYEQLHHLLEEEVKKNAVHSG